MSNAPFFSLGVVLLAMTGVACAPPDGTMETTPIQDDILAGKFNGKPWKFVAGATEQLSPESNQIITHLGTEPVQSGECVAHGTERIDVEVPFKPGVYSLGLDQTVTFLFGPDKLEATEGQIIVHEVSESVIRAGLYAIYNDNPNYEVSGQFAVKRCSF